MATRRARRGTESERRSRDWYAHAYPTRENPSPRRCPAISSCGSEMATKPRAPGYTSESCRRSCCPAALTTALSTAAETDDLLSVSYDAAPTPYARSVKSARVSMYDCSLRSCTSRDVNLRTSQGMTSCTETDRTTMTVTATKLVRS